MMMMFERCYWESGVRPSEEEFWLEEFHLALLHLPALLTISRIKMMIMMVMVMVIVMVMMNVIEKKGNIFATV